MYIAVNGKILPILTCTPQHSFLHCPDLKSIFSMIAFIFFSLLSPFILWVSIIPCLSISSIKHLVSHNRIISVPNFVDDTEGLNKFFFNYHYSSQVQFLLPAPPTFASLLCPCPSSSRPFLLRKGQGCHKYQPTMAYQAVSIRSYGWVAITIPSLETCLITEDGHFRL